MVQNLTRLPTGERFTNLNDSNCKYYMDMCFSFAQNLDCSLLNRPSLTWGIRPGESKILKIYDDVVQDVFNPLRFRLGTWKAVSYDNEGFVLKKSFEVKKNAKLGFLLQCNTGLIRDLRIKIELRF